MWRANFQGTKWAMGNRSSSIGANTFTGRDLCLGTHWNSPKIGWRVCFSKKNHKLHHRTSGRTFTGHCWKGHDSGLCIELLGVKWAGFSSAISACEKNGHWQIALKILTESLSSKRSATVIGWTVFFVKSSSHCKDLHFWIWRLGYLTFAIFPFLVEP